MTGKPMEESIKVGVFGHEVYFAYYYAYAAATSHDEAA